MREKNQLNLKNLIEGIMQDGLKKTLTQATKSNQSDKSPTTDASTQSSNATDTNTANTSNSGSSSTSSFLDPQLIKRIIQSLPAETLDKISHKIDGYKNESLELIKNEVHKLFAKVDLQAELEKLLSKFVIEIHAEVRLIPKDGVIKPSINANAKIKMDENADQQQPDQQQPDQQQPVQPAQQQPKHSRKTKKD
jgi:hypothetical protein